MILGNYFSLPAPPAWMADAVCATTDPEIFYPEKGGSTKEAKRVCRNCPVIEQCLQYALERDERFGIFGGCSERERRKMKAPKPKPVSLGMGKRPCEFCGTEYWPWKDTSRFCSKRCHLDNYNAKKRVKTCESCGSEFTGENTRFCSRECGYTNKPKLSDPHLHKPFVSTCRTCGVEFNTNHPRARYCGDECGRLALNAQERQRYRGRA